MNGTTIKVIAEHSGISEGVIYRHFESKDQLFFEAVVEPLKQAVDELVAATEGVDKDQPLTPERQFETMTGLYRQLISTLEGCCRCLVWSCSATRRWPRVLPGELRGGDGPAGGGWREVEDRYGFPFESPGHLRPRRDGHGAHPRAGETPRQEFDRTARSP